jgi:hypothetical protein
VRHVDLASNGLNEFGATKIAEVLRLSSGMRSLSLDVIPSGLHFAARHRGLILSLSLIKSILQLSPEISHVAVLTRMPRRTTRSRTQARTSWRLQLK